MRKRRNYYTKMLSSSTFRMIRIGGSVTSRKCYDKLAGKAMTQTRSYHDNVIDHYENPRNVGKSTSLCMTPFAMSSSILHSTLSETIDSCIQTILTFCSQDLWTRRKKMWELDWLALQHVEM